MAELLMACSYCGGVSAPTWFSSSGLWAIVGALALGGGVIGLIGLARDGWWGRPGALRIGLGLAVLLPLASAIALEGDARVEVTVEGRAPADADAWSVSCEVVQGGGDLQGDQLQAAFRDACADATRPARWASAALVAGALLLAVDGGRRLAAAKPARARVVPVA